MAHPADLVTFDSPLLRIACVSDTHNDDPTAKVPSADLFIHAGDMTNDGTLQELRKAYEWIAALPHRVKVVVAGNHDLGLDPKHADFSQPAYDLFTSASARSYGIHYIDRAVKTVAQYRKDDGLVLPLRVYGNPCQPDFLKSRYAFTYLPHPDPGSLVAWQSAPSRSEDAADIWVMHSPPKGRLDYIPLPPLTGCEVQRKKIAAARPRLCVFGHYHYSYGAERVAWKKSDSDDADEGIEHVDVLSEGEVVDFADGDGSRPGKTTVFLNSAWMSMDKTVSKRNQPWLVKGRL